MSVPVAPTTSRPFEDVALDSASEVRTFEGTGPDGHNVVVHRWGDGSDLPGLTIVDGALRDAECAAWLHAAHTDGPGFTDATLPWYQNRNLDWREKIFRRNTRAVVRADESMQSALWRAVAPFVPDVIDNDYGYGTWDLHSPNDAWRFYRYELRRDDTDGASTDCFPPHHDSTTVKQRNFASWLTILVYVGAEGAFAGGGTAFFSNNRCPGTSPSADGTATDGAKPVAVVAPRVGRVVLFHHTGMHRLLHAGCQLHALDDDSKADDDARPTVAAKTVLRSDVMYTLRDGTASIPLRPTPPFDQLEDSDDETVRACPVFGWTMPPRMPIQPP
eukprot:CAMPEP_0174861614 /NCGR_PEP_ID=MMETSP1114-20130205/52023_1 /TAXON_ID=312471 /ORGANISM="Neobodo designis, Strain CCAP 1951/1" /LENGTH=330 /DNA_ID=CAMNT_0016096633 /DNA_START=51 /DNA_END=1040 /DNA_ORIENTATION=-